MALSARNIATVAAIAFACIYVANNIEPVKSLVS